MSYYSLHLTYHGTTELEEYLKANNVINVKDSNNMPLVINWEYKWPGVYEGYTFDEEIAVQYLAEKFINNAKQALKIESIGYTLYKKVAEVEFIQPNTTESHIQ